MTMNYADNHAKGNASFVHFEMVYYKSKNISSYY